jgi:ABC-type transport system substrate-binding protein
MARNTDPRMEVALQQGRQSTSQSERVAAYQQVSKLMGQDIPYVWYDRTVWAIGAQPKVQNFANPTTPAGGAAFAFIGGAIWPTQIWLDS